MQPEASRHVARRINRLWFRQTLAFAFAVFIAVTAYSMVNLALAIREIQEIRGQDVFNLEATFQFTQPGGVIEMLEAYYADRGTWDGIAETMRIVQSFDQPSPMLQVGYQFHDADGNVLFDSLPEDLDAWLNQDVDTVFPLVVNGQQQGSLRFVAVNNIRGFERTTGVGEFAVSWLRDWLSEGAIVMILVGAVAGISAGVLMSRSLASPLKRLSEAAQAIGKRNLSRRVEVTGSTEVRQLAMSFNAMAEQLENAETLRSNLVADVAHELRTPLTVLQGNLRAILDDVYPLTKSEVAGLYDQTRVLNRLVNDLHEISQAEANKLPLNLSEFDIGELLHKLEATFGPMAEADGVRLQVHTQAGFVVRGDYARLSQVMNNLLANALHYTPSDGNITILMLPTPDDIGVQVRDTGHGINTEDLPHVFERFYRADRSRSRNRGGAGLGLAVSKAILEAHGGRIEVHSDGPGTGATFTFWLPRLLEHKRSTRQSDTSQQAVITPS